MFDYYALPNDFPGYADLTTGTAAGRIDRLQMAMTNEMAQRLPGFPSAGRFLPYIQQHEFEALLFSDPSAFEAAIPESAVAIASLMNIRSGFATPEDIDDGPRTAPSKRILSVLPSYEKATGGPLVAQRIGLPTVRRECPAFNRWVTRLEALGNPALH